MTKLLLGSILAVALLVGDCFNQSTNQLFDNRSGSDNPAGGSSICAGLVATLDVTSLSGSSVKAGSVITFAAMPRDSSGNEVPAACREGAVSAQHLGECTFADASIPATLDAILLYASAPGQCQARVSFAGKSGISEPVTIQ